MESLLLFSALHASYMEAYCYLFSCQFKKRLWGIKIIGLTIFTKRISITLSLKYTAYRNSFLPASLKQTYFQAFFTHSQSLSKDLSCPSFWLVTFIFDGQILAYIEPFWNDILSKSMGNWISKAPPIMALHIFMKLR